MSKKAISRKLLEQMQVDEKYQLSKDQIVELLKSFEPIYCAEVMIELGHTNEQIKDATKVNGCRISWMRVKYQTPPNRTQAEMRYHELNLDFIHKTTPIERKFCKLFMCGVYHKNYVRLTSRIDLK